MRPYGCVPIFIHGWCAPAHSYFAVSFLILNLSFRSHLVVGDANGVATRGVVGLAAPGTLEVIGEVPMSVVVPVMGGPTAPGPVIVVVPVMGAGTPGNVGEGAGKTVKGTGVVVGWALGGLSSQVFIGSMTELDTAYTLSLPSTFT